MTGTRNMKDWVEIVSCRENRWRCQQLHSLNGPTGTNSFSFCSQSFLFHLAMSRSKVTIRVLSVLEVQSLWKCALCNSSSYFTNPPVFWLGLSSFFNLDLGTLHVSFMFFFSVYFFYFALFFFRLVLLSVCLEVLRSFHEWAGFAQTFYWLIILCI